MFPFYLSSTRLGGSKREKPLEVEELTIRDLEAAVLDVRANADRIYKEIYREFSYVGDTNRALQPEWVNDARESIRSQQQMVVQDLEQKVKQASTDASDEFMYQDKKESQRELEVARKILEDIPRGLSAEEMAYRTWNHLPYGRYRGDDEDK